MDLLASLGDHEAHTLWWAWGRDGERNEAWAYGGHITVYVQGRR